MQLMLEQSTACISGMPTIHGHQKKTAGGPAVW
jgi:hypothetical protein